MHAQWFCSSFQTNVVSEQLDKAASMASIEHDQAIAFCQQLYVVDGVYSSRVCCTFLVVCGEKLHCDHVACKDVLIVAEQLCQCAAVCFMNVARRVILIDE